MVYYYNGKITVRDLIPSDAEIITAGEIAQGWDADGRLEKYQMRLRDQAIGKAISLAAEYDGEVAGYINVYPNAEWGSFGGQGLPEIVDFGVLEKFRRRGVGTALMDVAEDIAKRYADTVYLGVGLHNGYGSAQRMYVKRGYIPDGRGVWYHDKVLGQYENCCNDDDLVLYFSKALG